MLKNFLLPRLLKKVQMPGGSRCEGTHRRWVGGVRSLYVAAHPLPQGRQRGTMGERANAPRCRNVGGVERCWAFFSSLLV